MEIDNVEMFAAKSRFKKDKDKKKTKTVKSENRRKVIMKKMLKKKKINIIEIKKKNK